HRPRRDGEDEAPGDRALPHGRGVPALHLGRRRLPRARDPPQAHPIPEGALMDGLGNPSALYFLLGLVPIVAGYAWAIASRRRALRRLGPNAARLIGEVSSVAAIGRAVLVVVGLGLVCIAVARPQEAGQALPSKARGIDVVIALDVSKSMLAQDVRPSRL